MLDAEFALFGCVIRALPDIEVRFMQAPSGYISRLELGRASWQWELDASRFGPAAERVRTWAAKEQHAGVRCWFLSVGGASGAGVTWTGWGVIRVSGAGADRVSKGHGCTSRNA